MATEDSPRNLVRAEGHVSASDRAATLRQESHTLWFTGLSGSGTSTIAFAVERALHDRGPQPVPRGRIVKRLAGFLLAVYVVLFLALTLYGSLPLVSVFARSHVTPLPGGGVEFHDRSLLASAPEAAPLEATPFSNAQFGLELVLRAPHLRMRGPARIVAYSLNRRGQNWLVGQLDRSLIVRHRGREAEFPGAFGTGARQHFVISIADEIVSVHRDGRRFGTRTFTKEIVDWLPGCRLTLGNEVTGLRHENSQLKEMLAEMALRIRWLKKNEVAPGEDPELV